MKFTQNLLLFLFLSLPLMAQTNSVNQMYDELNSDPSVMAMSLGKEMITMLNLDLPKDDKTVDKVVKGIDEIRVAVRKSSGGVRDESKTAIKEIALSHLSKLRYTTLPKPEELKNQDVQIMVNGFGVTFSECHIIYQDKANEVLLSFFGKFETADVKLLADKLKAYR